jgi:hypothetical protein
MYDQPVILKANRRGGGRPPNPDALKHTGRQVGVVLPPELYEKVDAIALANGLSVSEMVRRMLTWAVNA